MMKTASYKLSPPTIIELFQLTNQITILCKWKLINLHLMGLDGESRTGVMVYIYILISWGVLRLQGMKYKKSFYELLGSRRNGGGFRNYYYYISLHLLSLKAIKPYIQYLARAHWSAKHSVSHVPYRLLSKYPSPAAYRSVASSQLLQC